MSNVQAAIKRNGVVVLLILLAALAVLLAGVRSGGPPAASADTSRPALPGPLAPRATSASPTAGADDARGEGRPDGPDQRQVLQGDPTTTGTAGR